VTDQTAAVAAAAPPPALEPDATGIAQPAGRVPVTTHELTVATLNLENGERLDLLPGLVAGVPQLDALLLQEGREWDCRGQERRFRAEGMLAPMGLDRSFLTRSTRSTLHQLVFIRSARLRPVAHYTPDLPDVFHDQAGTVELVADGLMMPLTVRSVHWPHWSGDARLSEALKLTRYAAPGACAVIAGDFNSLYPDCGTHEPEFEPDWARLPPHKRHHKTLPPGLRSCGTLASDRRALGTLAEAGLASAGCLAGDMTPTVSAAADQGQGGRIDHILLSPMLARAVVPGSYQVHVSDAGSQASDHRMVSVRLDLTRVKLPAKAAGR
jgi:endonuclease/exonuclease/phosphatase family metal-dependent hydrolase